MGRILFFTGLASAGHLTIALAIAKQLKKQFNTAHELILLVDSTFAPSLTKWNHLFRIETFESTFEEGFNQNGNSDTKENETSNEQQSKPIDKIVDIFSQMWHKDFIYHFQTLGEVFVSSIEILRKIKPQVESKIAQIKPDLILMDTLFNIPYLMNKDIPYGIACSANPLMITEHPELPPAFSGLPTDRPELYKEFRAKRDELLAGFYEAYSAWMKEETGSPLKAKQFVIGSDYTNIYMYPTELDYNFTKQNRIGNWFQLDTTVFPDDEQQLMLADAGFPTDSKFLSLPGKLIYFALGTTASLDVKLMSRLLSLLGELPHKFIVALGQNGDRLQHQLPANCFSGRFINQLEVLSKVDLFISHGGNNSFTEAAYFGVPIIILPLFGDQPDNRQRLLQLGMGGGLNPFNCTAEQLANEIQRLTTPEIRSRWKAMSNRIRSENRIQKLCNHLVEAYLNNSEP